MKYDVFCIYENDWELLVIVMGLDIRRAILRNMDLNANVNKKSIRIFVFSFRRINENK